MYFSVNDELLYRPGIELKFYQTKHDQYLTIKQTWLSQKV